MRNSFCVIWIPRRREGCASLGCSAKPRRRLRGQAASYRTVPPPREIRLISWGSMNLVSDIKLIRTDTVLDLSQKAEKGMRLMMFDRRLYTLLLHPCSYTHSGNLYGINEIWASFFGYSGGWRSSLLALFFALKAIVPGLWSGGACDFSFHLFILRACCDNRLHIAVWLPT